MKIISPAHFPQQISIGGSIEFKDAKLFAKQTSQEFYEGFYLELKVSAEIELNGFKIEPFTSTFKHSLTNDDFVKFIEYLNL